MRTYVALLRGINVGGRNRFGSGELHALLVALGHADVKTYIQSGNAVFKTPASDPSLLAAAIEERIAQDLGMEVKVLIRTRDELEGIVRANPFVQRGVAPSKLHVTFLSEVPDEERVRALPSSTHLPDEFHVAGREMFLLCPDGYGRSKLNNAYFERRLGVTATTRHWSTVTKLLELSGD